MTVFCRDCKLHKPETDFYPYRINGDRGRCKPCDHIRTTARRKANPELIRMYLRRSQAKDREKTRRQGRENYYRHREARKATARAYYHRKKLEATNA
jgi:hypothetical protein